MISMLLFPVLATFIPALNLEGSGASVKIRFAPLTVTGAQTTPDHAKAAELRTLLTARKTAGGDLDLGVCQGNTVDVMRVAPSDSAYERFKGTVAPQGFSFKEISARKTDRLFQVKGHDKTLTGLWSVEEDQAFLSICQTD